MTKAPPSSQRRWTVIVYFSADNNLAEDAVRNLNEMLRVGSSPEVQLLALCDLPDVGATSYVIRPTDANGMPRTPLVRKLSDSLDTGDPRRISAILEWALTEFPAEHYGVVVWGHADGWDEYDECRVKNRRHEVGDPLVKQALILDNGGLSKLFAGTSVTMEDLVEAGLLRRRDFLNNFEIKSVFRKLANRMNRKKGDERGQERSATAAVHPPAPDHEAEHDHGTGHGRPADLWRLDVLGFDACLMGMAEVAGQLTDSVRYVVASEAEIPNRSWPYLEIFEDLLENPHMLPSEFSAAIVNHYVDACERDDDLRDFPATLSVLDLDGYRGFVKAMAKLREQLESYLDDEMEDYAIHQCLRVTQSYFANSYVDIYDFCQKLAALKTRWKSKLLELEFRADPQQSLDVLTVKDEELSRIVRACKKVMGAISGEPPGAPDRRFVFYERHAEAAGNSHGVSIFFPSISRCYPELVFSQKTGWSNFLAKYIAGSLDAKPDCGCSDGEKASTPGGDTEPSDSDRAAGEEENHES